MNKRDQAFVRAVLRYYRSNGRHTLPWRIPTTASTEMSYDPYAIVVSEIMLQQTQVDRVIPKYTAFLAMFPTIQSLARAPLHKVLALWSGLGYNRRAKFLHQMAREVVKKYKGIFPCDRLILQTLPGIGPYTAGAIVVFAYNTPVAFVETNIRSVMLHHFFSNEQNVSDRTLLEIIDRTLDRRNPRQWYWALMDYGSYLKRTGVQSHRISKHYVKQSPFEGSRRQVRGQLLKTLLHTPASARTLATLVHRPIETVQSVLDDLVHEEMVIKDSRKYRIS